MRNQLVFIISLFTTQPVWAAGPNGCGVGEEIHIEFPQGLSLPSSNNDRISQAVGVAAVEFTGTFDGKAITCTISNESERNLSVSAADLQTAYVGRSSVGKFYFVEMKNSLFQLACNGTGSENGESYSFDQLKMINEAMSGRIVLHYDLCIAMN